MQHTTRMDVPLSLGSFNKTWCDAKLKSYNATATIMPAKGGMTMGALAFSVVLMLLLGFTLLCSGFVRLFLGQQSLNLFLGRYNLYPAVRVLLRITFVLFLPLLSTVFSLTKGGNGGDTELLLMLLWMLLIELIRKKVQVMVMPTDGSSFARGIGRFTLMDYSDEVAHVLWTGYLVYSNIQYATGAPMKAMFAVLWALSMVKLVQRALNVYIAGHSFHTARNPLLIASYMQYVIDKQQQGHYSSSSAATITTEETAPTTVMETCEFVVTGEKKVVLLKKKKVKKMEQKQEQEPKLVTTLGQGTDVMDSREYYPSGHSDEKVIGLDMDLAKINELITVEKVWKWGQHNHHNSQLFSAKRRHDLENLCLSFSLFKLLRRRFEKYPMVEVGTAMARKLMLRGLLDLEAYKGTRAEDRPFKVLQLELDFLENYYQAADQVVMSQPVLFFLNFALSMLFVPLYLVAVVAILISNKDAAFLYCSARGWTNDHTNLPQIIFYLSITLALVATLVCIEASEFFTSYFFSNWNTVRLACLYGGMPEDRRLIRQFLYYFVALRFLMSSVLCYVAKFFLRHRADPSTIKINQVSVIGACGPLDRVFSAWTYQVTLTAEAKGEIIKSLKKINEETGTVSLPPLLPGMSAHDESTRRKKSVTEIILATHLATELFEMKHQEKEEKEKKKEKKEEKKKKTAMPQEDDHIVDTRAVATTLSRYCMYLAAHLRFLLSDDETWVSERLGKMRTCLTKQVLKQCGGGTMCTPTTGCRKTMAKSLKNINGDDLESLLDPTTRDAVTMFRSMESWGDLASFWVEMLIYLAPSNDAEGHAKVVASSGGDLITYLWAFCTHAGITRCIIQQPTTTVEQAV